MRVASPSDSGILSKECRYLLITACFLAGMCVALSSCMIKKRIRSYIRGSGLKLYNRNVFNYFAKATSEAPLPSFLAAILKPNTTATIRATLTAMQIEA